MNEEINRNEERQESPRRRRRSELHSAPAEDTMGRTMEVRIPGKDALRKSIDDLKTMIKELEAKPTTALNAARNTLARIPIMLVLTITALRLFFPACA